jgi:hypothetical protein
MMTAKVTINRAPVLTLWATLVAERLGYDEEAAPMLGKAVAGLNAQSRAAIGYFRGAHRPTRGEGTSRTGTGRGVSGGW